MKLGIKEGLDSSAESVVKDIRCVANSLGMRMVCDIRNVYTSREQFNRHDGFGRSV
jgi:hypothetical protein